MTETEMRQLKKRSRDAKKLISDMTYEIENYEREKDKFEVYGNKGCDIIQMKRKENNTTFITVFQSCVCTISAVLPTELIVAILTDAYYSHNDDFCAVLDDCMRQYDAEYRDELKAKILDYRREEEWLKSEDLMRTSI